MIVNRSLLPACNGPAFLINVGADWFK